MDNTELPSMIKLHREWQIGNQIDSGGFARVFGAQSKDVMPAVVKLIPKKPGAQRELLFEELNDIPNVVPIIDKGEWGNFWVLVMPKATTSLRHHLSKKNYQLSTIEAVPILIDLAKALSAIKDRVVHRDIKPENILLLDGHWCLADFGIARYAESTTAPDTAKYAWTPAYAAPEQWREQTASNATDIYSFGIVAYELLSGKLPFQGPRDEFRQQHLTQSPIPIPNIPNRLWDLVNECLYKNPQTRPSAQNLLDRLMKSTQPASPAASLLQQANTVAVERRVEVERKLSAAQAEEERYRELYDAAIQSWQSILSLLQQQINDNAPSTQVTERPTSLEWALNNAALQIDHCVMVQPNSIGGIPFEIAAHSAIAVSMQSRWHETIGRSHSLWFCDAKELNVFRWYETAFMHSPFATNPRGQFEPFSLSPENKDCKLALDQGMHTVQVAWPFTAIDQGSEESFVDQWIDWFAKAAHDQLRKPSRMPEKTPRRSWRR